MCGLPLPTKTGLKYNIDNPAGSLLLKRIEENHPDTIVIDNSGTRENTRKQNLEILQRFQKQTQ